MILNSKPARNCPDAYITRAGGPQRLRTRAGGRTRREHVVHEDDSLAVQTGAVIRDKRAAHVRCALLAREQGLGRRGYYTPEQFFVQCNLCGCAQMARQPLGLIEFALAMFHRIQRNRDDEVPVLFAQGGFRLADEQVGEKWLEPERALVFVAVDCLPDDAARDHRRACRVEMQLHLAAVRAFKWRGQIAGVGQAAAFAKRRADEAHLRPAMPADKAIARRRGLFAAKLAGFGIKKSEADIEPVLNWRGERSHLGIV